MHLPSSSSSSRFHLVFLLFDLFVIIVVIKATAVAPCGSLGLFADYVDARPYFGVEFRYRVDERLSPADVEDWCCAALLPLTDAVVETKEVSEAFRSFEDARRTET